MKYIGDHLVLFSFDYKEDVDRIIAAEPWSFDKNLMVVSRYENETEMVSSNFNTVSFWIQIHDIPLRFRNRGVAEKICVPLGTIMQTKNPNDWDGGSFIRIRVALDISLPLCRGRLITLDDNEAHWVSFRYERLPNVCYWCGCLTHPDKDCEKWIESEGSLSKENQQYGPWLRAGPYFASKKGSLSVQSFYAQKKAGKYGQSQARTSLHAQNPQKATEGNDTKTLPPKIQNQILNPAPDNSAKVTAPLPVFSEPPYCVPPQKPTQDTSFEQIIDEIDRDIQYAEGSSTKQRSPNESYPVQITSQQIGLDLPNEAPPADKPVDSVKASPLTDISNIPQAHADVDLVSGRKWTRFQRPNFLVSDEHLEFSLGKRGPLPNAVDSIPQKRRATSKDDAPSSPSQTAVAGRQPHRAK